MSLAAELEANFDKFTTRFEAELTSARATLVGERQRFLESYARIASLNAWREQLLAHVISADSLGFFLEAQNDALTSHVFARFGAWRSAYQALRSCIENIAMCGYFKDHPVELRRWHIGAFRIAFSAVHDYLEVHPDLAKHTNVNGLAGLKREDANPMQSCSCSRAFSDDCRTGGTRLWSGDHASAGKWATRERETLRAVNLLLMTMFREHLQGAKLPALRGIIRQIMPVSRRPAVKKDLAIVL